MSDERYLVTPRSIGTDYPTSSDTDVDVLKDNDVKDAVLSKTNVDQLMMLIC